MNDGATRCSICKAAGTEAAIRATENTGDDSPIVKDTRPDVGMDEESGVSPPVRLKRLPETAYPAMPKRLCADTALEGDPMLAELLHFLHDGHLRDTNAAADSGTSSSSSSSSTMDESHVEDLGAAGLAAQNEPPRRRLR